MIHLADDSGQTGGFSQCVTHCSFPQWWHQAFYNFFTFSCLFIVPLLIMLICNAKIIFTLTRVLHQDPHRMYPLDLVLTMGKQFLNSNTQSGAYYVPDAVLSSLRALTHLTFTITPGGNTFITSNLQMRLYLLMFSVCTWG